MISWKAVGMNNVVGGLQQNRWDDKMTRCALHRWYSGATFTCEFQSQNRVANLKQDFSHLTASGRNQWWLVGRRLDKSNSSDKWGKGARPPTDTRMRTGMTWLDKNIIQSIQSPQISSTEANLLSPPFFSTANSNRCVWVCADNTILPSLLRENPISTWFSWPSTNFISI